MQVVQKTGKLVAFGTLLGTLYPIGLFGTLTLFRRVCTWGARVTYSEAYPEMEPGSLAQPSLVVAVMVSSKVSITTRHLSENIVLSSKLPKNGNYLFPLPFLLRISPACHMLAGQPL